MKTLFTALLLCVAVLPNLHAQKGWYLKAGAGYAFPLAGQTFDHYGNPYSGTFNVVNDSLGSNLKYDLKKVSFSSGLQGTAGIGYMFNKNLGVEVAANLGILPTKYNLDFFEGAPPTYKKGTIKQYATEPIMLTPAFVMQVEQKKVKLYARGGIVLPLHTKMITERNIEMQYSSLPNEPPINDIRTLELKTKFGIGFSGAMGAKYSISKNMSLWVESALTSLSLYAKEETITVYRVDGFNVLPLLPRDQIHWQYETENNGSTNALPAYSVPYSNIAINAGISIKF